MTDPNTPPGTTPPAQPGYATPNPSTNGLAIASLIVSIVALLACCLNPIIGVIVAIVGAVMGGLAEKQIREGRGGGMGLAKAGRIIGIVVSILLTLLAIAGIVFQGWALSPAGQDWFREQGVELDPETSEVREIEPGADVAPPVEE